MHQPKFRHLRHIKNIHQRGITLVEFMIGMAIGMLVTLAAVGSIIVTRNSARSMTDSAALEQQASLVMAQIGQQIIQAGAINAYLVGTEPNEGIDGDATTIGSPNAKITFDTRPIGVNVSHSALSVLGQVSNDTKSETLTISYAQSNDNGDTKAYNCIGNNPDSLTKDKHDIPRVVNSFDVQDGNLRCGSDAHQPIASGVVDMRINYLLASAGKVMYQTAAQIEADGNWPKVTGIQICLHMQGDFTQAPEQDYTGRVDCQNNPLTKFADGRVHLFVRQTFYLRNSI